MKRFPLPLIAAALLAVAGLAGLVRGAESPVGAANAAVEQQQQQPIVVSGAYVREPANGINAAAYFTLTNTTDSPEVLTAVTSGAGETTLHTGSMRQHSGGLSIPARGSATLSPGKGHIMITKLYGPLKAGQSVNFQLSFEKSGQLLLTAPVIAVTAQAPTAEAPE